jgi:hypothetical protein
MVATAFTKFDPFSFLENRELTDAPAKPAKVANVLPRTDGGPANTLAPLAKAELHPASQNLERPYERMLAALCERCPDFVEEYRWREATADGIAFVSQWGEQAAALGWTVRDLFGLAEIPERPGPSYERLSRYDQTGLVWLLQGRRAVAFTQDTAVIETATGTVSYRRHNKPALGPLGDSLDDMGSPS